VRHAEHAGPTFVSSASPSRTMLLLPLLPLLLLLRRLRQRTSPCF
jgi:hypothetical protein